MHIIYTFNFIIFIYIELMMWKKCLTDKLFSINDECLFVTWVGTPIANGFSERNSAVGLLPYKFNLWK